MASQLPDLDAPAFHAPVVVAQNAKTAETRFWPKVLRVAGRIPFADDLATAYFCAVDPKTPTRVRGVLLAAIAYFVLPTDLIPDFIAALGFTDDASVAMAAFGLVGTHVRPSHRRKGRAALGLPDAAEDEETA